MKQNYILSSRGTKLQIARWAIRHRLGWTIFAFTNLKFWFTALLTMCDKPNQLATHSPTEEEAKAKAEEQLLETKVSQKGRALGNIWLAKILGDFCIRYCAKKADSQARAARVSLPRSFRCQGWHWHPGRHQGGVAWESEILAALAFWGSQGQSFWVFNATAFNEKKSLGGNLQLNKNFNTLAKATISYQTAFVNTTTPLSTDHLQQIHVQNQISNQNRV